MPDTAPIDVIWDMETSDPDDFLTLLLLIGHPHVNLKAITVVPGSAHQVGVVRWVLATLGCDIPVGASRLDHPKSAAHVSGWHYKSYGEILPSEVAEPAETVLLEHCDEQTTLITGGPLTNIRRALLQDEAFTAKQIMVQGGFAGEGVVPPELQLEKFKGLTTCPTHNLMGDKKAADLVAVSDRLGTKFYVSKNVCHRVYYDATMHAHLATLRETAPHLDLIWQGMEVYLQKRPQGKLLHDPLAACCAIDPTIATWAEVEVYRQKAEWGARLAPDSNTRIIVDYDHDKFVDVLTMV